MASLNRHVFLLVLSALVPLLLLAVLLVALGVQLMGLGLVGEIIVHLRAPYRRAYRVRERT